MRASVGTRLCFDKVPSEASSVNDTSLGSGSKIKRGLGFERAADFEGNLATPDDFMASTLR